MSDTELTKTAVLEEWGGVGIILMEPGHISGGRLCHFAWQSDPANIKQHQRHTTHTVAFLWRYEMLRYKILIFCTFAILNSP